MKYLMYIYNQQNKIKHQLQAAKKRSTEVTLCKKEKSKVKISTTTYAVYQ